MYDFKRKIDILNYIDSDDSRFIVKVIESFQKKEQEFEMKKGSSKIQIKDDKTKLRDNAIDLDTIWAKPYIYTRMRQRLECLVRIVEQASESDISNKPNQFCRKAIFNGAGVKFRNDENQIDIVDYLKNINNDKDKFDFDNIVFYARAIDEESLFKEEQISKALELMKMTDMEQRNSAIYDEVYSYLDKDFISNKYCDFINDRCIAQRNHQIYPFTKKDGCCFMNVRKCPNLENGNCKVECMGCRLFACNYLTKRGVGYWAEDFVLFKLFFNKRQRQHLVFDFYKPKSEVLYKINKIKGGF